jgi:hypothetical protein
MADIPMALNLSPADVLALQQMVYGEETQDTDTMKMIAQSALNRLKSGKKKEFGGSIPEITKKGYYAVSKQNTPYKQALSQKFPDITSKVAWGNAKKVVEAVVGDKDYGDVMFYFKPDEEKKLKVEKKFDFSKVRRTGKVGNYNLYSY